MGRKVQINYRDFLRKAVKGFFLSIGLLYSGLHTYSQCPKSAGTEAIKDGGFENGGDVSNSYGPHALYTPSGGSYSNPGLYYIGDDVVKFNYGLPGANVKPRTGSKMLMVDASTDLDPVFFQQTVNVVSGQLYFFSCWITSLADLERCNLQFQVKGINEATWTTLGPTVAAPDVGVWQQVYESWNSGTNLQATIRMVNIHPPNYGYAGNDYAIDDISFINTCPAINNGPKPDLGAGTISLCNNGGTIDLNSNVAVGVPKNFTWFKDNIVQPVQTSNTWDNVTQTGDYVVCVESNTCVNSDTVKVVSILYLELGPNSNLCSPATRKLNTGITASANFKIVWKKDGVIVADSTGPSFTVSGPGIYKVEVTDLAGGNCNGTDEVTITSDLPVPNNFTFCPTTNPNQTFSVIGNGKYKWWTALTGGTAIAVGNSYNATGLTGTTTFYVEDTTTVLASAGLKNDNTFVGNDKNRNNVAGQNFLNFTANKTSTLDGMSVKMFFYNTSGGSGIATLIDNTNSTTQTKSIPLTYPGNGEFYVNVNLGFQLIAGHTYTLTVFGNDAWCGTMRYYDPSLTFIKYPVDYGPVKFTGSQTNGVYPGLFDWVLSLPSECARMPVTATEDCPINCVAPLNASLASAGPLTVCKGDVFNQVITASISNTGAATFQYEFFNGNTVVQAASPTNTYTVTQAGAYKVVVSDIDNPSKCKATTNILTFTIDSLPVLTTTVTPESCAGKADGKIDLNSSGNGPFAFTWSNTASSEDLNNLAGGTYSVTVTDSKNCTSTSSATVSTLTLTASATATDVLCKGNSTGSVTLTVTGGTSAFTYLWNNAAGNKDLSNIPAGPYSVTVTDSKGCTATASATVNEPATAVAASVSKTDVKCNGENDGTVAVIVNGGMPTYTYLWSNSATTQNLDTVAAGKYSVTVKDANSCIDTASVIVNEPNVLTLLTASTNVTCLSQGTITANGNGGTSPLNYSIDATNYVLSGSFTNLATGDYIVTLKDAEGCITGKAVTIGSDIVPPTVTPTKTSVCIGDSAILSANASASYLWAPNGETSQSITIADSGKYSVTVTDANGCSATSPVITITLNQAPVVDLGADSMIVCPKAKIILGSAAVPGNSYSWTSTTGFTSSKAMPEVSALITSMYKLTVTRNGCMASDSLTLYMEDPMTLFIPSAFSPNKDGKNEEFSVASLGITTFNGYIFNIWGELIYEWDTAGGAWNGTYMDQPVQEGVYVYNIRVRDKCTKGNVVRTGVVSLIR